MGAVQRMMLPSVKKLLIAAVLITVVVLAFDLSGLAALDWLPWR